MPKLSNDENKLRRLRRLLFLFFLALLLPTGALLLFAANQMKWEVYHQFRQQAESLTARIDSTILAITETENLRKSSDYRFLIIEQEDASGTFKRSPLSVLPGKDSLPGLIGHFQIEPDGKLTSPLLPAPGMISRDFGVNATDLDKRQAIASQLRQILLSGKIGEPDKVLEVAKDSEHDTQLLADSSKPKLESKRKNSEKAASKQILKKETLSKFDSQTDNPYRQNRQRIGSVAGLRLDESLEQRAVDSDDANLSDRASSAAGSRAPSPQRSRKERVNAFDFYKLTPPKSAPIVAAPLDGNIDDLAEIETSVANTEDAQAGKPRRLVKLPEPARPATQMSAQQAPFESEGDENTSFITSFESEVDPLKLAVFDDEHIVLYRNVWTNSERIIQGAVLHRETFIDTVIRQAFIATPLVNMSQLLIAFNDDVLNIFGATNTDRYASSTESLTGSVLYRSKLAEPFNHFSLIFNIAKLPLGAGMQYLMWVTVVLLCVLTGGCYFMYRFGKGQIALFQQQQDFVSAVSHELKTPLTSIRMYSEMLKNSWASDDKKPGYYEYIHSESERLSRLIENVLQLARINHSQSTLKIEATNMGELMANAQSKLASIIEAANFEITENFDPSALSSAINCSQDATLQIMINIIDNAIKFSRKADKKQIDIRLDKLTSGSIEIGIRDYGPGIDQTQMKKIFELFYRTENELTRETVGTGIGLALVHQLATSMGARIDARNCHPGVEFILTWPPTATITSEQIP